jgi:DNA recombination protein RmuC
MEILAAAVLLSLLVAGLARMRLRPVSNLAPHDVASLARSLGQLQSELTRVARTQDELRQELQRGRESSLQELAQAAQGIRSEIGSAQRALAEVKALEQGRARQLEEASASLRRLEAVVAGSSSRGAAGENILAQALMQLPRDLLDVNVAFGSRIVEYALRLPGGRLLPIDSKWTSVAPLERLAQPGEGAETRRLLEQVARDVRLRARELAKYLDPERTLSIALLAVPDAVYAVTPEAQIEAHRDGVLVVPYSQALPYVLAVYRLALRFGCSLDQDQLTARITTLDESLRRIDEEIEGRLSRGLVQVDNARAALRDHVAEAQRTAARLLRAAPAPAPEASESAALRAAAQPDAARPDVRPAGLTAPRGSL